MRKIEQQMLNAIKNGDQWVSGNTQVHWITGNICEVYLYGNHIATVNGSTTIPNHETFRSWPTPTTRSRPRALGVNASIKNFLTCIDGEPI